MTKKTKKSKLSHSVRTYIRRQKARIRRSTETVEEYTKQVAALVSQFRK